MSGGLKTPINEMVLIPKVAPLLALGKTTSEIATTLNIGFQTVRRLAQKDETKQLVREITDSYKDVAKAYCAKAIAEMNELSMDGLRKALKDGNIQAIRTHLQVIGLLGTEEAAKQQQGAGTIQVILPGASVTTNEVLDVGRAEVSDAGVAEEVALRSSTPSDNH